MRRSHHAALRFLGGSLFAVALSSGIARAQAQAQATAESATEAAPRDGSWLKMHEGFLDRAAKGEIDLLFLGDSITAGWNKSAESNGPREVWDRYYGPRHAANFGIGGDRTQHVLWRIEHGEVDGIKPKVVVLMIGTNNVRANTSEEIAAGITTIVKKLGETLPESKVLLLGVFPRSEKPDRGREKLAAVNETIAKLDNGKTVKYLDIGPRFVNDDATISREIMPDSLHLSRKGYRIWADAIEPTLRSMLDEG